MVCFFLVSVGGGKTQQSESGTKITKNRGSIQNTLQDGSSPEFRSSKKYLNHIEIAVLVSTYDEATYRHLFA